MQILVFGASGRTGAELVRQSLERGHTITAFARTPEKLGALRERVRVVQGNVRDADAVRAALPGHTAVVSCLGVSQELEPDPDVVAGVRNIVTAMQGQGVKRFVYQSFIGVTDSRAAVGFVLRYIAPIPLKHEIADHETKEAIVRESPLDWTIVRPPKLTNGARTERYRSGTRISTWTPVPMLSRADVAHFILNELEEPAFVRMATRLLPA